MFCIAHHCTPFVILTFPHFISRQSTECNRLANHKETYSLFLLLRIGEPHRVPRAPTHSTYHTKQIRLSVTEAPVSSAALHLHLHGSLLTPFCFFFSSVLKLESDDNVLNFSFSANTNGYGCSDTNVPQSSE